MLAVGTKLMDIYLLRLSALISRVVYSCFERL